mgnify:CR=1 FL=1
MYKKYFKRLLDVILSLILIILLSPVMLIIAMLVRIKLGSPVIFKQKRPGRDEKIFTMYKFRTMANKRDEKDELLPDEIRLTSFGKALRSTSLDELPELFNVLLGDMSMVGPRPLLIQYLDVYNNHQRRRHNVRPGLTGWAQVNGRNALEWEQKFKYDVEYVDNLSFLLDMKIIWLTAITVCKREGINSASSATMEIFTGTPATHQNREYTNV